jgi:hypothetical protein
MYDEAQADVNEITEKLNPAECLELAWELEERARIIRSKYAGVKEPAAPAGTASKDLTAFAAEGACLVIFDCKTDTQVAGVEISPAQLKAIKARASKTQTSVEDILRYIFKAAMADVDPAEVKIPKAFFQVNLSSREQKEMRKHARKLGVSLRTQLRNTVLSLKRELRDCANFQQKMGMSWSEQIRFFKTGAEYN